MASIVQPDQISAVALDDRAWFVHNPRERVRFRPERHGEFAPVEREGYVVPAFTPPQFSTSVPLSWVAVVELTRLLAIDDMPMASSMRIRFRTVPVRSRAMQQRLAPIYEDVVVHDFLRHHSTLSSDTAA